MKILISDEIDKSVNENIKQFESIAKETYQQIAKESNTVGELIENLKLYIRDLRYDFRYEWVRDYIDTKFTEYFLEDMKRVPIQDS